VLATQATRPILLAVIIVAAIGSTTFMLWIPTDRG
jgi:hypothetical protein